MWAAAGFHTDDALGGQGPGFGEDALVFLGVDVVGDHCDLVVVAHGLAQGFEQRRLAGADRAADTDAQGLLIALHAGSPQERNKRVYWVS
ncbi:hypothetical protein D3C75_972440 [compost metagenome]